MMTNKWFQFAMNILIAVLGSIAAFDWTTVVSASTAGLIASIIAIGKAFLNTLLPSSTTVAQPTGGAIITHTS